MLVGSPTGNDSHYSTSMIDTLPKFDPTEYSGMAVALALDRKHAPGPAILTGKSVNNNNNNMATTEKSSKQNSSASF